jgi:hypothetical protein
MSIKLTDTQLVLLSAAAQRKDRCLVAPETLKGGASQNVAKKLISMGLAKATKAKRNDPIWRRDEQDETAAHRILAEVDPDILLLNAGAPPPMGGLDQLNWADFTAPWEHDVKAGLYWLQAALNQPLKPGSRVLAVSSGAAENGNQLP